MNIYFLIIISFLYYATFNYGAYVLDNISNFFEKSHQYNEYVSLVFLPHGIRVLSAWLYRGLSILYILPVSLYVYYSSNPIFDISYLLVFVGAFSGYLGFVCFKFIFPNVPIYADEMNKVKKYSFINIFFVIVLSAIINSSLNTLVLLGADKIQIVDYVILFQYGVGDILGAIFFMFLLLYAFKLQKFL